MPFRKRKRKNHFQLKFAFQKVILSFKYVQKTVRGGNPQLANMFARLIVSEEFIKLYGPFCSTIVFWKVLG